MVRDLPVRGILAVVDCDGCTLMGVSGIYKGRMRYKPERGGLVREKVAEVVDECLSGTWYFDLGGTFDRRLNES